MQSPSFVLIMTDTQGANIVGAYGHPALETPNIDRLAEKGVRFDRAYTTSPVCTPARAGLLSGVYSNLSGPWANNLPFAANIRSVGQRFQDQGYQTAYIGKWHLDGHDYFGTGNCPPGWDQAHWYDTRCYLNELSPDEAFLWRQGLPGIEQLQEHNIEPSFTMAHRVSDRAIDFLQHHTGEPFVLVVSYDEPHHPHTCPPAYAEKFVDYRYPIGAGAYDDLDDKPYHHRKWAEIYEERVAPRLKEGEYWQDPLYFGCNSFVDHEIGRVIDAVYRFAPENSTIIYTSDHGAMMGAHQLHDKGPAMYEEITRIPLIIATPDGTIGPSVNNTMVSHIDLLPTMLEMSDMERPPILAGKSLAPLLKGMEEPEREVLVEFNRFIAENEFMGGLQPVRCLAGRRYKLVLNLFHSDELYDLELDPAEVNNLINQPEYISIRNEMHDRLLERMNEMQDPFEGACWEQRPWRDESHYPWAGKARELGKSTAKLNDGYAPDVREYLTGRPYEP